MRRAVLRASGRRALRLLLTGCLFLGLFGLGAAEAHAAAPSSLAGETFTSTAVRGSSLTGTCPDEGNHTDGSFHFSVSGTASGPFPGTFTESGSFTTSPSGPLQDFSSAFTIKDPAGTVIVTGTKSLRPDGGEVSCVPGAFGTDTQVLASIDASYSAMVPGGEQDTGPATVSMNDGTFGSSEPQVLLFTENFGSTGAVHKQCKHGRWNSFGTLFKNQGDCVSFFATRGKNRPSGS